MAVINCPEQNEMVYFDLKNPALVLNIFEQEDGILVAVHSGSESTPSIEALISDGSNTTPLDVFNRIAAGEALTVGSLFVGEKAEDDEDDEDVEPDEDDEDTDGEKRGW